MSTWLVALAGGAIGSIMTWVIAYAGRVAAVRREVDANDRALRVIDDHLETWVADDTVRLRRELHDITEEVNKHGLLWSGEHGVQIATRRNGRCRRTATRSEPRELRRPTSERARVGFTRFFAHGTRSTSA
jgi:hypothetical protein